ncbi:MAG: hypothetical protein ACE5FT_04160 [Candidatus Nanoarchaeia archaeon]
MNEFEENIYNKDFREEALESDAIEPWEAAFLEGMLDDYEAS